MYRQKTECPPRKCFRCVYVNNLIDNFPKPPKDNEKQRKTVRFNEKCNCAQQKESEDGDHDNYQKIYESMTRMSGNDESYSRDFGDSSQLTDWILDYVATCHMTPQVLDFISGSL